MSAVNVNSKGPRVTVPWAEAPNAVAKTASKITTILFIRLPSNQYQRHNRSPVDTESYLRICGFGTDRLSVARRCPATDGEAQCNRIRYSMTHI